MGRPKGSRNKNIGFNEYCVKGDVTEIYLESKKHGSHVALIDTEYLPKIQFSRWQILIRRKTIHVQATFNHSIYLHRVVCEAPLVDHKNGDGLDNRKQNLRPADKRKNAQNSKNRKRFKGTKKAGKRWSARIKIEGKESHIGCFNTEIEAAQAYNNAALLHFGDFARLNRFDESPSAIVDSIQNGKLNKLDSDLL